MFLNPKNRIRKIFLNRFPEKSREEIEKETIKKFIQTINYYMSDSLTVLLGQAELLEQKLRNDGLEKENTQKFIGMCKKELSKIRTVLSSLREVERIKYRNHSFGFKFIDLEEQIKQDLSMTREKSFLGARG